MWCDTFALREPGCPPGSALEGGGVARDVAKGGGLEGAVLLSHLVEG